MPQTSRGDFQREVSIPAGGISLAGTLSLPKDAQPIVLFAHGSGSSRYGSRNRFAIVAGATRLFEEPGALEEVAGLACDSFERHLLAVVHS